ncbi:MAG: hypothetical protein KGO05_14590, partial [Chloroflexota bacterium]|nr:hypothetical protein [Chloroflexota bacterium]
MTQPNRSRALRQVRSRRTVGRATWPSALVTLWSALRRGASGRPAAAVLLLLCASLLTGARLGVAETTVVSQRQVTLRVSPPTGFPTVARWLDVQNGTSFTLTLALQQGITTSVAVEGHRFAFTTPTGDQLQGAINIAKLPDGSYTEPTPNTTPAGQLTCAHGVLNPSKGGGGAQPVTYTLDAHFDQYAMVAYAHIVYALARDAQGSKAVCSGQTGQAGEQAFDMLSGCDANTCASPVDTAGPTVTAYESSVVGAAKQGNAQSWKQVYAGASRAITAQYGGDRFGTVIAQQAQKKGRIKSITPTNTAPQVQFDTAGQAYFV